MKTLVILSHPSIGESGSQQFLIQSVNDHDNITLHHLEREYPDGMIDVEREQNLLLQHDRIIFQFPFYWYSSPPLLKRWQDDVLTEHFAYGYRGDKLKDKEFGLVLSIGVGEKEYETGGQEGYSISELTKPYQAVAKKTGMIYLKPFSIFQFAYKTEEEKMGILIAYQQYLSLQEADSLKAKEEWMLLQLEELSYDTIPVDEAPFIIDEVINKLEDNRLELDELRLHIDHYAE